ncbi:hypothetical protein BV25DRAFT_1823674 [Artomyces pyxidatus]|uniref:Uncharacterized protein n=1 Tax=Artomyces pyxidatus TaxID=48021 RepID=A0ACB8T5U9_9AGAM|nr:hypothetical protein BV25DRAFT_1823674 [Artomyces pyxidatus]
MNTNPGSNIGGQQGQWDDQQGQFGQNQGGFGQNQGGLGDYNDMASSNPSVGQRGYGGDTGERGQDFVQQARRPSREFGTSGIGGQQAAGGGFGGQQASGGFGGDSDYDQSSGLGGQPGQYDTAGQYGNMNTDTEGRADDDFGRGGFNSSSGAGAGTGDNFASGGTQGGKASMMDKLKGTAEKMEGKMKGDQGKQQMGEQRKRGEL